MNFTIAYFGVEKSFHVLRDFILSIKYGLEDCGHSVDLSSNNLCTNHINIILGGGFLDKRLVDQIISRRVPYICFNTEIIANGMLNYNPSKTDFDNAYLPLMRSAIGVFDIVHSNMVEHQRYGNKAALLRLGYQEKLDEIAHRDHKDIDFYFFGSATPYRAEIVNDLYQKGFTGFIDGFCPYYLRNDRIARAKVQLNIRQQDYYSHVTSTRLAYLLTNRCTILSEPENDPLEHYMPYVEIAEKNKLADTLTALISDDRYKDLGVKHHEEFKKVRMADCVREAIEIII